MIEVVLASSPNTVQGVELKQQGAVVDISRIPNVGSGITTSITGTEGVIFGEPTPTSRVGISGVQTLSVLNHQFANDPPCLPIPGPGEPPVHDDPDEECPDCAGDSGIIRS